MSALSDAIERSFSAGEAEHPAVSPLRALGRRQLSGIEVLAQAVATTAPAASMVVLPAMLLQHTTPLTGLLTIVGATVLISLVALCVTQFTRRQAAAGGLHSFVFQGLGTRAALTAGVAIGVKYLGSATLTLYSGAQAVTVVLGRLGVDASGPAARIAVYCAAALVALVVLVRGARVAAVVILVIELCSLVFIVALTVLPAPAPIEVPPAPGGAGGALTVALVAIFMLAGFESATFFGPEARRPLVTVTRVVLLTPMLCGALLIVAAWAAFTGHSAVLVDAYLHGTSSGASAALVVALNVGLSCSWLASAMASSHAASRLAYSMGVERLLPRGFARVHQRFRTPHRAIVAIVVLVTGASATLALAGPVLAPVVADLRHVVRAMVVAAYVLVAVASVRFLTRIRERTPAVALAGLVVGVTGAVLLGRLLGTLVDDGGYAVAVVVVGLLGAGVVWQRRLRPGALARVGAFDHAESADVLPGAGAYAPDAHGNPVLVADARSRPDP